MASLLDLSPTDTLLEPAAGDGHLIAASRILEPKINVTAYEIHPQYSENLRARFLGDGNIRILEKDTIFCPELDLKESFGPKFSKIIANPPYGGWQELDRRSDLKKRFPGFYVKETYTLFLLRCLRLLKDEGRLVFIIPATFLYLNLHSSIREFILRDFTLESIDLFDSKLFPGIAFAYADLCIVCISANRPIPSHSIRLRAIDCIEDFGNSEHRELKSRFIVQHDVLKADGCSIPLNSTQSNQGYSERVFVPMSDIANCVTGFYSGNDKRFLRRSLQNLKRAEDYAAIGDDLIERNPALLSCPLEGIEGDKSYIPILKGGGYNFLKPSLWYMDWSKSSVAHYKSDKKSRFQNSSYYFKRGVGFPMVTSSRPTAALLENSLFDQSVVGIFPKTNVSLEFILAYCNSAPFWNSLKSINPSANNSCKYVLRTPIYLPEKERQDFISLKTKELIFILQNNESGAELLQREILKIVEQYTKS